MNFTEMTDLDLVKQKNMLQKALDYFLAGGRGEATIMLAPAAMLPALANADAPQNDVQLFTLTLRQASRTLIVDVAAYQGGEGRPLKGEESFFRPHAANPHFQSCEHGTAIVRSNQRQRLLQSIFTLKIR